MYALLTKIKASLLFFSLIILNISGIYRDVAQKGPMFFLGVSLIYKSTWNFVI